ncbi:hypothetical protein DPMN_118688 [Dreissena polymorpha]|uniref:Uncharacterized protein n=1 Tax=Dreissena polymorpha TaxID=45954 RepID=A0A9D4JNQ8_DREPO|nr:hypothetical protein DPMN_118688 [Dreissena polymorpha]
MTANIEIDTGQAALQRLELHAQVSVTPSFSHPSSILSGEHDLEKADIEIRELLRIIGKSNI